MTIKYIIRTFVPTIQNNPLRPPTDGLNGKSMKTTINLSEIFKTAWSFVKRNGMSMSDALKVAWTNYKLHATMLNNIVKFYFMKVDGTIREAYGTLKSTIVPVTGESNRKKNDSIQTYFDTEKNEWRCFKKANLIRIAI